MEMGKAKILQAPRNMEGEQWQKKSKELLHPKAATSQGCISHA